jgi:hypothetical protein
MLSGSTPVHPWQKATWSYSNRSPSRTWNRRPGDPGASLYLVPNMASACVGTELVIIRFGGWLESGRTERRRCEGQDEHDERRDREPSICLCQRGQVVERRRMPESKQDR